MSLVVERENPEFDVVDVMMFLGLAVPLFLVVFVVVLAGLRALHISGAGVRVLVPQIVGYLAALIPLYVVFRGRYGESPMRLLRMGVTAKDAASSVSLGILTAFAVTATAYLLKTPQLKMPMDELLSDPASIISAALVGVTVGPWFEELIFRGLLQPLFGRYTGAIAGILLSSVLFSLLHGPQYAWSWRHVVLITCAGAAFGLRRLITNSTGAAIVMHSAYNLVLFSAFLAAKWANPELPKSI